MKIARSLVALLGIALFAAQAAGEAPHLLAPQLRRLRIEGPREWSEFPETPEAAHLEVAFSSSKNESEWTLRLRQQDVKQTWAVLLNGKKLGSLVRDENDMVVCFPVPAGAVVEGENVLRIEHEVRGAATPDDVRVGEVVLHSRPRGEVLGEATAEIEVLDADSGEPLPARITVVNAAGALQTVGADSNDHLAVRPGVVFTSTGAARFGLPAGKYTVYAGRGFEYSLASVEIDLAAGKTERRTLKIRREVPTAGYAACDTHTHTLTHSGHGDATVEERMITLAAEGIELAIATDHNVQIDHEPFARQMNVRRWFTPVIGNEVTTRVGHFNVFPVAPGASKPDHALTEWDAIFDSIYATPGVKVAILNHARDLHSGVRPFGPALFNAAVGENLDGWAMRFNAMEVVNSGATQTDVWRLFHDWMALVNRGRSVTPVGSSDSHDVARHFVGQGRTYIRCDDRDASAIDVEQAVNNFVQGRVMVSYGLLAEIVVNGKYGPGELAPKVAGTLRVPSAGAAGNRPVEGRAVAGTFRAPSAGAKGEPIAASADGTRSRPATLHVAVRVLGPHWVEASRVVLFANGRPIREEAISPAAANDLPAGVKWRGEWTIPQPPHDVYLTTIAIGPGVDGLYWKTAKPYQPTSPEWTPHVIGCSGAVWVDADGDGRRSSAYDYARLLVAESDADFAKLLASLADYDRAVAAQAAHLWQASGESLLSDSIQAALRQAAPETQAGYQAYLDAWRETQMARAGQ